MAVRGDVALLEVAAYNRDGTPVRDSKEGGWWKFICRYVGLNME